MAIPSTTMLFLVADVFNVSVDYLLGRTNIKGTVAEEGVLQLSIDETVDNADVSEDTKRIIKLLLSNDKMRK